MALADTDRIQKYGFFSGLLDGITRGFVRIAEANWRAREVSRLYALSDEALAQKGLKREDIPHHVFRDVFWA
ncbi:DUF1127 domain-containing protein [Marivita sp. GX14005]|uniref:DUF1127 domain-containing protein n=1 Tax=Marivita sp. GX14005 TaxID=2942276 RepID=UPI002019F10F|nr:DUF1127 domain-containing protein [Marivita sp. GX14005]MCL3881830.1 DUF1127 domain-containing protein [Marivita sp. GX14005]